MSEVDDINLHKTLGETDEKCPQCGKTLVEAFVKGEAVIKCPDKECGYKKNKE